MTLPKTAYIRIEEPDNDEPFMLVWDNLDESATDDGETATVGVYKLIETKRVKTVTQIVTT